ncbi:MAG: efflux RND transporter permease subunit [Bacteroidales bacterium]|nr:efflux RND transporter permease subunit [Bacteroidales bacterium]
MVKFLINRPIAVSMSFLAIVILGIIAMFQIPVSLLPSIDIPKITVQVVKQDSPARELENTMINPLRQQLMQLGGLHDIRSETKDGNGLIHLDFEHGINIDFAFIEVNEKIDRAMGHLPNSTTRPKVIKASVTDIPVFYLNLTLKEELEIDNTNKDLFPVTEQFMELSRFSGQVIKKRIEQLPEAAMVDISGQVFSEILIIPNIKILESLEISLFELEAIIKKNNVNFGSLLIRDGQYQYNIRFTNSLKNKKDIEDIFFNKNGRLFQLKDIADIVEHPQKSKGLITSDGKHSISMAIIKQSDAKIQNIENNLHELIKIFEIDYPLIEFKVTRDQTKLLDYTLSNLQQSLVLGSLLAFLVMFFFLKDFKSPLLIGIGIPVSLIITLLLFFLAGISINIISLSGLILGIGMMIDNSIIVIDNITQHYQRSNKLEESCINGTNEVFRPMLSSVLTTCAVFIPLIFIGGISGALFYEQAIAISIGLIISLVVSISLLPVYYKLLYKKKDKKKNIKLLEKINRINYEKLYSKGFRLIMRNQLFAFLLFVVFILAAIALYPFIDKSQLPEITKDEIMLKIDWNQRIHIDENNKRVKLLMGALEEYTEHYTAMVGNQQFLLDFNNEASSAESLIYIKSKSSKNLNKIKKYIRDFLHDNYKTASYSFEDAGNIFNVIFADNEAPLIARLRPVQEFGNEQNYFLEENIKLLRKKLPDYTIPNPVFKEFMILQTNPAQLLLYDISFNEVYSTLKSAFNERNVFLIADNNEFVPVIMGKRSELIKDIIKKTMIPNSKGELIPIRNLLSEQRAYDIKTIIAGQEGEYYPIELYELKSDIKILQKTIRKTLKQSKQFEVSFTGSIFSNDKLIKQLIIILLISLLLLYFILASQFESLSLPLIVLFEVPVDIFGAFLFLKIFGATINLMSLIGIVVMSGIIINDSILKIDTINQLMTKGYSLIHALVEAGHRRLKPILMTSLTTILALTPFLFTSGLGSDLQRPLALAIIGGMVIGTLVSLYFIPLFYYLLKRNRRGSNVII